MKYIYRVICLVLLIGCGNPRSPADLLNAYAAAANEHDVEAVLSLVSDDARFDFGPIGVVSGKEAIRGVHEYDRALGTHLRLEEIRVEGNQATCRIVETNAWLDTAGIGELVFSQATFEIDGSGLISGMTAIMAPESSSELLETLGQFDAWAREHEAEAYLALFREDGSFAFGFDNGVTVLDLLRRWREAGR